MPKNDVTQRNWPVDTWRCMFAERPRKTEDGDLRKTCSVAGYDCVDKVGRSDCHTRNGRRVDRGGFEHGGDGVGDAMAWVGSSGCLVPEL